MSYLIIDEMICFHKMMMFYNTKLYMLYIWGFLVLFTRYVDIRVLSTEELYVVWYWVVHVIVYDSAQSKRTTWNQITDT